MDQLDCKAHSSSSHPPRVIIVGGGIAGLAAAHRLVELDARTQVTVLEASQRVGGVLRSERREGFLIEHSADMFTTRESDALDLCRRIGLADELIPTSKSNRKAFVVRNGRAVPVPIGFTLMSPTRLLSTVFTRTLSVRGRIRMFGELLVPPKIDDEDESLESFAVRRFGREAYQRLIQPMIGGIYTADPRKLSMRATMRQFVDLEHQHGSVFRGMRHEMFAKEAGAKATGTDAGVRYGQFVAPKEGMQSLVDRLESTLPDGAVCLNTAVRNIQQMQDRSWQIEFDQGQTNCNAVILATPAAITAQLLRPTCDRLADDVASIEHAGASVVVLGYRDHQFQSKPQGFGLVVPSIEQRKIIACSFASHKFAGRAPEGTRLLRVFVGGALQPELVDLDDDALVQLVKSELRDLCQVEGEPILLQITRWAGCMPQYHVGHLGLVQRIEAQVEQLPGLELAGNAYRGVGIPFCIRSGEQAAQRIFDAAAAEGCPDRTH